MLRRILRIQYASDLHLEHYEKTVFQIMLKPVAPVLALAGDIGQPGRRSYRDFLYYCSRNWEQVFVVAGNHELYHPTKTASTLLKECQAITEEFDNVHFMDRRRIDYNGISFLGTTLWTNVSGHEEIAQKYMNDYRMIRIDDTDPRLLTPADVTAWHLRDRAWIRTELDTCKEPTVILTHHLPLCDMLSKKYHGHPLNPCFATDCTELVKSPVVALVAGHTHSARCASWIGPDLAVISGYVNPYGYPSEQDTEYSRERYFDVKIDGAEKEDHRDPLLVAACNE